MYTHAPQTLHKSPLLYTLRAAGRLANRQNWPQRVNQVSTYNTRAESTELHCMHSCKAPLACKVTSQQPQTTLTLAALKPMKLKPEPQRMHSYQMPAARTRVLQTQDTPPHAGVSQCRMSGRQQYSGRVLLYGKARALQALSTLPYRRLSIQAMAVFRIASFPGSLTMTCHRFGMMCSSLSTDCTCNERTLQL